MSASRSLPRSGATFRINCAHSRVLARFRRARATPGRSRRNSDDPQFGASSDVIFRLPKRPKSDVPGISSVAVRGRPGPNLCENNVCFHVFFSRRFGPGRPRTATELIPGTSDLALPGVRKNAPGRTRKTTQNHQKPSEIAFTLAFWRDLAEISRSLSRSGATGQSRSRSLLRSGAIGTWKSCSLPRSGAIGTGRSRHNAGVSAIFKS